MAKATANNAGKGEAGKDEKSAEEQVKQLEADKAELESKLKAAEQTVIDQKEAVDAATAKADAAADELKSAQAEAERLQSELKTANEQNETLRGTLGAKAGSKSRPGFIRVTAAADRRRANRSFAQGQPVEIAITELKPGELQALRNDPVLAVQE